MVSSPFPPYLNRKICENFIDFWLFWAGSDASDTFKQDYWKKNSVWSEERHVTWSWWVFRWVLRVILRNFISSFLEAINQLHNPCSKGNFKFSWTAIYPRHVEKVWRCFEWIPFAKNALMVVTSQWVLDSYRINTGAGWGMNVNLRSIILHCIQVIALKLGYCAQNNEPNAVEFRIFLILYDFMHES